MATLRDCLSACAPKGFSSNCWPKRGRRMSGPSWSGSRAWDVGPEAARLERANRRVAHRLHAGDLHVEMGPATRGKRARFRVLLDGKPPASSHGCGSESSRLRAWLERHPRCRPRLRPGCKRQRLCGVGIARMAPDIITTERAQRTSPVGRVPSPSASLEVGSAWMSRHGLGDTGE